MLQSERPRMEGSESRLRLQTAVRLRWFGVVGQLLTVCYVYFGLGFQFDIGICLALIALTAWLNVFLRMRYSMRTQAQHDLRHCAPGLRHRAACGSALPDRRHREPVRVPDRRAGDGFGRDAAAAQHHRARRAGGGATACLVFLYRPLPWYSGEVRAADPLQCRRAGLGAVGHGVPRALCLAAGEGSAADDRGARGDRDGARARAAAARPRRPAAAAAHELGTPLSTIAVVAKELAREAPKGRQLRRRHRTAAEPGRALPRDPARS